MRAMLFWLSAVSPAPALGLSWVAGLAKAATEKIVIDRIIDKINGKAKTLSRDFSVVFVFIGLTSSQNFFHILRDAFAHFEDFQTLECPQMVAPPVHRRKFLL